MDTAALEARISSTLSAEPSPAPASTPTPEPAAPSTPTPAPEPVAATPPAAPAQTSPEAPVEKPPVEEEFRFADEEAPAAPDPNDLGDISELAPKEVIDKMMQTERGRKIYQGYKFMREVAKPPEQGGLGFTPSVEQMREFHQAQQDLELMTHEFHSGDPTYAENFVKQWFQPNPQTGQFSPGAQRVAGTFLNTLLTVSPDLYKQAALPAVQNYVEELYRYGSNPELSKDERIKWLNVAHFVEHHLNNGKTRPIAPEIIEGTQPPTNGHASEIDLKLQRITQFEQDQIQRQQQWFNNSVNGAIHKNLTGDVEAALAVLKPGMTAKTYQATVNEFRKEVAASVNNNPAALRNFVIARDNAKLSPTPENIGKAAQAWGAVARPIVKQLRSQYLADAGPKIQAESDKRHATLQEASAKTGNGAIAAPGGGTFGSKALPKQPGESHKDWMERRTAAALGALG